MIQRASLFLSLALLGPSACTSSAPIESHVGERLERFTRRTKAEFLVIAKRHELRERLRATGARVCEEGDWPQRWRGEGCRVCGCDVGDVAWCNLRYCPAAERGPESGTIPIDAHVEGVESQVGKRLETLTRRTMGELEVKARRHEERENFRTAGARVCEEGDWPQEWWDGCQWCWCDVGQVRDCQSLEHCDEEVMRKLRQQQADEELENPSTDGVAAAPSPSAGETAVKVSSDVVPAGP